MIDSIFSIWLWAMLPIWLAIAAVFVWYVCPRLFRFVEDDDE